MALSAYDDPRNLAAYEQMRQQDKAIRYQNEQMRNMQNFYAQVGGIGYPSMQSPPKQEEPNKVLLLLPPVA